VTGGWVGRDTLVATIPSEELDARLEAMFKA
jgi:hypothetical protein